LELLKEIAPRVARVAVIRDPTVGGDAQMGAILAVASSFGVEVTPVDVRDIGEIESTVTEFAHGPN
jgi:putative ABC transport system substrate-binding protein